MRLQGRWEHLTKYWLIQASKHTGAYRKNQYLIYYLVAKPENYTLRDGTSPESVNKHNAPRGSHTLGRKIMR